MALVLLRRYVSALAGWLEAGFAPVMEPAPGARMARAALATKRDVTLLPSDKGILHTPCQ